MPIQNCGDKNICSSNNITEEQYSIIRENIDNLNLSREYSKCRCAINYTSLYKDVIISPFNEIEFVDYTDVIQISPNMHYEIGTGVTTLILPLVAEDQDQIIIQDFSGNWNNIPLKIFNFSSYCYGINLNKSNITVKLRFNQRENQWELEGWSYDCIISPEIKRYRNYITRYKYNENNIFENIYEEYFLRIVGFGYSTFIDINNIWIGDNIKQIYFYPTNGQFVVDLKDKFNALSPGEKIEFDIGSIDGFEYYRLYYANIELLENTLERQRLKFYADKIFDIKDGDMLLRSIHIIQIGADTKTRDPISLNNIDISNVSIYNKDNLYKYEENKDYIIKNSTGEIIPTIEGKIMPGDNLLIRYAT